MILILWITLFSSIHAFMINDFRVQIQLCDDNAGENVGDWEETPWLMSGGGWSSWASNDIWEDPDGIRIGLEGRYNGAGDDAFELEDTDIRFCIQLSDDVDYPNGNSMYNGQARCTPWASAGGGWSDWAADINYADFDAVKIKLQTQSQPGLLITDVRAGLRVTDGGKNSYNQGYEQKTEWLIGAQVSTQTWSQWAGSYSWTDPDAIKIYLGVHMSLGNQDDDEEDDVPYYYHRHKHYPSNAEDEQVDSDNIVQPKGKNGNSMELFEIVILCFVGLIVFPCLGVLIYRCCKNKKNNDLGHEPIYLDDNSEEDMDENSDEDVVSDIVVKDVVTNVELDGFEGTNESKKTLLTNNV